MKKYVTLIFLSYVTSFAQPIPGQGENIPYLVTFGSDADIKWGDDDFVQTFFFVVPKTHQSPLYIRVYDPGIGQTIDEKKGDYNTRTRFSVYGGIGCISNKDARQVNPIGKYKSGNLLDTKVFANGYDQKWYSFGPFNPTTGELDENYGGYVFKIIAEGISGNDGNLYKYFLSTSPTKNQSIEGSNSFTYEYTFRMHDDPAEVSHVYPYIDTNVISIKQGNFDWDNDGDLVFNTNKRLGIHLTKSGNGNWAKSEHKVFAKEKESTFDIQFHKNKAKPSRNNNIAFWLTNQYDEALPFYNVPIGGAPNTKSTIKMNPGNQ